LRIIDRTLHLSRAADEEYKNNVRTYCTASLKVAEQINSGDNFVNNGLRAECCRGAEKAT
jgi:hypothetical protein